MCLLKMLSHFFYYYFFLLFWIHSDSYMYKAYSKPKSQIYITCRPIFLKFICFTLLLYYSFFLYLYFSSHKHTCDLCINNCCDMNQDLHFWCSSLRWQFREYESVSIVYHSLVDYKCNTVKSKTKVLLLLFQTCCCFTCELSSCVFCVWCTFTRGFEA